MQKKKSELRKNYLNNLEVLIFKLRITFLTQNINVCIANAEANK
tara:strand:- start:730 stop:861 length:132 start_codon:yes stop_codon:yes gene_type:complete